MDWFDNLVGAFWILLQIMLWVGLLSTVGLILVIVISAIWDGAMRRKLPTRQRVLDNAQARAISTYRHSPHTVTEVDAFVQGADYAYSVLNPNRKK